MPYYCVEGEQVEYVEEFVKAKNKKEAIESADVNAGDWLDKPSVKKISKKEYNKNTGY